jgi:hypothetical protein
MVESAGGAEPGGERNGTARKVVTIVLLAVTGLQLIIWLMMCLIAGRFFFPFPLFSIVLVGVLLFVLNRGGVAVQRRGVERT